MKRKQTDICSSLHASLHIDKLQLLWTNKLDNWDIPPVSPDKSRVWLIPRWRVINELLDRKLCQRRLSLSSRRRRKATEALAKALTMRSV
jgi:hypothetical protein